VVRHRPKRSLSPSIATITVYNQCAKKLNKKISNEFLPRINRKK
jgi:hypothetical protein